MKIKPYKPPTSDVTERFNIKKIKPYKPLTSEPWKQKGGV